MPKQAPKKSSNLKETAKIAKDFLAEMISKKTRNKGTVVGLSGNLGAGKTAFTKEIAKFLKVKGKVNSPTFVIMKKYPIKIGDFKFLYHLDAYRLKNHKELIHLGWDEIVSKKEHLIFVEWPENVKKAMPKGSKYVTITQEEGGGRNFKFK
jgi:tRNA threonylcarbamoyladenosine biosynthesis protein TsaE